MLKHRAYQTCAKCGCAGCCCWWASERKRVRQGPRFKGEKLKARQLGPHRWRVYHPLSRIVGKGWTLAIALEDWEQEAKRWRDYSALRLGTALRRPEPPVRSVLTRFWRWCTFR